MLSPVASTPKMLSTRTAKPAWSNDVMPAGTPEPAAQIRAVRSAAVSPPWPPSSRWPWSVRATAAVSSSALIQQLSSLSPSGSAGLIQPPKQKDGLTGSSCSNEVPAGGGHSQQLGSLAAQQGGIVLKLGQHGWVHLVVQDSMLVHVHAGRHLRRDRSRHYEFLFVDVNRQQDAGGLQCVDVRRAEIVLIATTLPWTVPKNGKLCI